MDLYPLYNSVRIALISTAIIFFVGTATSFWLLVLTFSPTNLSKGLLNFKPFLFLPSYLVEMTMIIEIPKGEGDSGRGRNQGCG